MKDNTQESVGTGKAPIPKGKSGASAQVLDTPQKHASMAVGTEQEVQQLLTTDAKEQKKRLSKQSRVDFMVPLMPGEKQGAVETVQINGYKLTIQKGVIVSIPRQVADILADHYRISSQAGSDMLINRPFVPTADQPFPISEALG